MKNEKTFIIDFDSTFVQVETFDILADIALSHHPEKAKRLKLISELTNQAMEGRIGFEESLEERISLLSLNQNHILQTIEILKQKITPSFLRNKHFFKKNKDNILVFSGSFIDIIWPVLHGFDLNRDNVFANRFLYDYEGTIHGYDKAYPLAQNQGKIKLAQQLNLKGDIIIIGDGYNDYELKESGIASTFIAFTENVTRQSILPLADAVSDSLEGVFLTFDLPFFDNVQHKNVLLLENIHPHVVQFLTNYGYNVISEPHALAGEALIEKLKGIHLLGIRSKTQVNADILKACPDLESIGAFCIGTNQIDLKTCSEQGIAVFNAPFSNTRSVVELALAEIILLVRQAAKSNRLLCEGTWLKSSTHAHEVRGKTLGIIGYGNIGSQLSIVAEALGMHVIFYDLDEKLPLGNARACPSLDYLLEHADIITVHVDGRKENHHLISTEQFEKMKDGAIFLNLSRDFVVNYEALLQALSSKKLAGIGVDVFPNEPYESKAKFTTPLQPFENVILTPHIGGSTEEAQHNIGEYVSKNIHQYCSEGATLGSVNFPILSLPRLAYPQRIVHIHHNVPGILAKINKLFAESKCNIEGQFLKTNDTIGYVITDLNQEIEDDVLTSLRQIEHTIKVKNIKSVS